MITPVANNLLRHADDKVIVNLQLIIRRMSQENESPIVIYEDTDKAVEVRLDTDWDTAWLTQRQMAELFDTSTDNVSLHLKNIYRVTSWRSPQLPRIPR